MCHVPAAENHTLRFNNIITKSDVWAFVNMFTLPFEWLISFIKKPFNILYQYGSFLKVADLLMIGSRKLENYGAHIQIITSSRVMLCVCWTSTYFDHLAYQNLYRRFHGATQHPTTSETIMIQSKPARPNFGMFMTVIMINSPWRWSGSNKTNAGRQNDGSFYLKLCFISRHYGERYSHRQNI